MSNPDLPRPYGAEPGRDDRAWNGAGNGRRARSSAGYDSPGSYDRGGYGGGYDRGRTADRGGRGGRGYSSGGRSSGGRGNGGRGAGGRDPGGWDEYAGRGSGRGAGRGSGRGAGPADNRTGWQRASDRAAGSLQRASERATGAWQRVSDRGGRGSARGMSQESWQGRGPGGPPDPREWRGGGTSVRDRYPAGTRPGGQYRGDGRIRGLADRRPGGGRGGDGYGGGRGGRGRGPGRKGDWWRYWTWKKALTVAGIAAGTLTVVGAGGVGVAYSQTTIPNPQATALSSSSSVYFSDGKTLVGRFGSTNRQVLGFNQIPALVRNAVVAAEDKNFWHEGGVSPTGILRAAYYDLTSSGSSLQGASTITQQLVRNYYDGIGTAQTASRKIKEIFVAEKLAQVKSKQWILEQYLNTVYFGAGAYGVAAAAQTYFGLPVSQLSAAQAAMIASMIQSPSYYDPSPKGGAAHQALLYRWGQYVLPTMVKMGTLSPQAEAKALKQFPAVIKAVNNDWSGYRGYIMQAVNNELRNTYHLSQAQINNGGLHIVTTFSHHLMSGLYKAVAANKALMKADNPPTGATVPSIGLPGYVHIGAVLENPHTGAVEAMYSGPNYAKSQYDSALVSRNQVGSSFKPYVLAAAVKLGMNVQTSKLNGYAPLWIPPDSQPNTFASLTKPASSGSWYQVHNDETSNPNRPVSVVEATALSLNTAYTDLWHRVAYNAQANDHPVVDMAKALGVNVGAYPNGSGLANIADQAGTALGQASLTVEEQATMIATLANGGTYHTPHVIKQFTMPDPLTGLDTVHNAIIQTHQVLTPEQAADVDYALSFDTKPGLGTAPNMGLTNGQNIIAKTGTTNLSQQAFFEGATPMDAMAVGMFVDKGGCTVPAAEQYLCNASSALSYNPNIPHLQTLFGVGGWAGYGGQWPAEIWHTYFVNEFNTLPVQAWPAVNNWGSPWNLVGQLPPAPKHTNQPNPQPTCFGFGRHCKQGQGGGQPTPAPTPTPTPTCGVALQPPCPTPTGQPTAGTKTG